MEKYGRIDCLVNNAGTRKFLYTNEMTDKDLLSSRCLDRNVILSRMYVILILESRLPGGEPTDVNDAPAPAR